jgi:hypothetical protein
MAFLYQYPKIQPSNNPTLRYFQPPPFIQSTVKYQDVNNDKNLQNMVTTKFVNKTIRWINTDSRFKKCKKYLSRMESPDGYDIMYRILKLFVKKGNTNWYDLSDQADLVKDFIRYKLCNN